MMSTVVTHQNIRSENFEKLTRLSQELDVPLDLQCATVSGGWRGNLDVLINAEDAARLKRLQSELPLLRRDVWAVPGCRGGCPAATRSFYVIPSGDVLPCLFIHVSFGNVYRESLAEIVNRMIAVPELREFSGQCLAGEDLAFIDNHLSKTFVTDDLPLDYRQVFGGE